MAIAATMRRLLALAVVGACAGLGAGCASNCTGDARFDSLGCASANLSSGAYERQTDLLAIEGQLRQNRARAESGRAAAAVQRANLRQDQRRGAEAAVSRQAGELSALEAQRNGLRARLAALQGGGGSSAEIAGLERDIAALNSRISSLRR